MSTDEIPGSSEYAMLEEDSRLLEALLEVSPTIKITTVTEDGTPIYFYLEVHTRNDVRKALGLE